MVLNPTINPTHPNHEVPEELVAKSKKYIILFPTVILLIISATLNGILFYQNLQLKKQLVQNIPSQSPSPELQTLLPTPDPTADWISYINTKYNYSFRYPSGFILETSLPGIAPKTTPDENSKYFDLMGGKLNPDENIYVQASDYFAILINTNQWEEPEEVVINNLKAEMYKNKKVDTTDNKILYRFRDQEKEIQVDFILTYLEKSQSIQLFDQILSTFKFIEESPSSIPSASSQ